MAPTLIMGEREPQFLEKNVWQRYFVTDCSFKEANQVLVSS